MCGRVLWNEGSLEDEVRFHYTCTGSRFPLAAIFAWITAGLKEAA